MDASSRQDVESIEQLVEVDTEARMRARRLLDLDKGES